MEPNSDERNTIMKKHQIQVKKRDLATNVKQLRRDGVVPGNVFGASYKSQAIQFSTKSFKDLFAQVGESGVVYLNLDKKETPAMIDELQLDPVTDEPIHVSFKVVNLLEKVTAQIPVKTTGEIDIAEAVLVTVLGEIEVEALPTDLPEKFEIDVTQLTKVGQSITLADLKYDRDKVEIVIGEGGLEAPVLLVQEVAEEVEEVEEPTETEVIGEKEGEETESVEEDEKAGVQTKEEEAS